MRIKPIEFFTGDLKKMEPFLDGIYGSVEVEYGGPKKVIRLSYEVWKDGNMARRGGWAEVPSGPPAVALFCVRPSLGTGTDSNQQVIISIRGGRGTATARTNECCPSVRNGQPLSVFNKSLLREVEVPDSENAEIWAWCAVRDQDGLIPPLVVVNEEIMDAVKRMDWAIVMKACVE